MLSPAATKDSSIRLLDLVFCLSDAMDFIDPAVVSHHKQVAYIASCIGESLGISPEEQKALLLAGALHDVGSFSLEDRRRCFDFEFVDAENHAQAGYALLKPFRPLENIATAVRFHHVPWKGGRGAWAEGQEVPLASHVLHLADRVAIQLDRRREVLGQAGKIRRKIVDQSDRMFHPGLVAAFLELAGRESFWLDLVSPSMEALLVKRLSFAEISLASEDMLAYSRLFARIIDFKSPFTASHSNGVSAGAEMLARLLGLSDSDCRGMRVAGYLHDLGKLAVPSEILNKPARLRKTEMHVVRHHTFYTYRILERIQSLHEINAWASYHHERLDGSGYPFHLAEKDLPLGSQIMAVADVFTAVAEDRPYRSGMAKEAALRVLRDMAGSAAINGEVVEVLGDHYDEIDAVRREAQAEAVGVYRGVLKTKKKRPAQMTKTKARARQTAR